jgi:lipoprotein-anchoring transpeptidase ErfK/SrfK
MAFPKTLLPILVAFGWGTALALPAIQTQVAVAQEATTAASQEANVPVTEAEKLQQPETETAAGQTQALNRRLILKLRERRVYVYEGDKAIANYRVAVGKKGWETPTGNFQVIQKVPNPIWQNPWNGKISQPGPKSPLGERWIGFWSDGKNTIGFHGTPGEHLIGQAVSHGCVRMRNADVKALFDLVEVGTPVLVQP